VLQHRGIAVGAGAQATIGTCRDTAALDAWLGRALTVTSLEELLA
jgi:hypothetical protein